MEQVDQLQRKQKKEEGSWKQPLPCSRPCPLCRPSWLLRVLVFGLVIPVAAGVHILVLVPAVIPVDSKALILVLDELPVDVIVLVLSRVLVLDTGLVDCCMYSALASPYPLTSIDCPVIPLALPDFVAFAMYLGSGSL